MNKKKITLFMEYQDGSAQSWGYDYPQLDTDERVATNMAADFHALPTNIKADPLMNVTIAVDYKDGDRKTAIKGLPSLTGADFSAWVFEQIAELED